MEDMDCIENIEVLLGILSDFLSNSCGKGPLEAPHSCYTTCWCGRKKPKVGAKLELQMSKLGSRKEGSTSKTSVDEPGQDVHQRPESVCHQTSP